MLAGLLKSAGKLTTIWRSSAHDIGSIFWAVISGMGETKAYLKLKTSPDVYSIGLDDHSELFSLSSKKASFPITPLLCTKRCPCSHAV